MTEPRHTWPPPPSVSPLAVTLHPSGVQWRRILAVVGGLGVGAVALPASWLVAGTLWAKLTWSPDDGWRDVDMDAFVGSGQDAQQMLATTLLVMALLAVILLVRHRAFAWGFATGCAASGFVCYQATKVLLRL